MDSQALIKERFSSCVFIVISLCSRARKNRLPSSKSSIGLCTRPRRRWPRRGLRWASCRRDRRRRRRRRLRLEFDRPTWLWNSPYVFFTKRRFRICIRVWPDPRELSKQYFSSRMLQRSFFFSSARRRRKKIWQKERSTSHSRFFLLSSAFSFSRVTSRHI